MNHLFSIIIVLFIVIGVYLFGWVSGVAYTDTSKTLKEKVTKVVKKQPKKQTQFESIKDTKTLNVVFLNSLSTYAMGIAKEEGFEYDMLQSFATSLGVELNITVAQTTKEALELTKKLHPHITSAGITKTPELEKEFTFGPSYLEVQEQVICNRNILNRKRMPKNTQDLAHFSIMVGDGTSYSQTLRNLQKTHKDLNVTYTQRFSTEEILAKVAANEVDCSVINSNIYAINLKYFPEIALAFTLSEREQLAWIIDENATDLKANLYAWLNTYNQSGKLAQLHDHYYGNLLFFDYYGTKIFYKRLKTRLPKYIKYFKEASTYYGIPWRLLAAISYQESHWDPNARSFTGVRGLMMLTKKTAKLLGVKNRRDPKQSIIGGTRHIKQMIKFVPKDIKGENRIKFALAAYNLGLGHIYDAQILARKLNLNDKSWNDLKKVLPLLAYKKHYKSLKYGYARGSEAIKYVESIYNYRKILQNVIKNGNITLK